MEVLAEANLHVIVLIKLHAAFAPETAQSIVSILQNACLLTQERLLVVYDVQLQVYNLQFHESLISLTYLTARNLGYNRHLDVLVHKYVNYEKILASGDQWHLYAPKDQELLKFCDPTPTENYSALSKLSKVQFEAEEATILANFEKVKQKGSDLLSKIRQTENNEVKKYARSCVGGTYDAIHDGHKILLSVSLLASSELLLIGITGEEMLSKKKFGTYVEPYAKRAHNVKDFVEIFDKEIKEVEYFQLHDPFGPWERNFNAIILSQETKQGGDVVNSKRTEKGLPPMAQVIIEVVSDETAAKEAPNEPSKEPASAVEKMSSTHSREKLSHMIPEDTFKRLVSDWEAAGKHYKISDLQKHKLWLHIIIERYSEHQRHYHDMSHVSQLLNTLEGLKKHLKQAEDAHYLLYAILFHDVIYTPASKLNEERSVLLMKRYFDDNHVNEPDLFERLSKLIIHTKNHLKSDLPADSLDQMFLDMDMSILAEKSETYETYAKNVRKEYCHFNDENFKKGRLAFLSGIQNAKIFKSLQFESLNELAQKNIEREIQQLKYQSV